mgnify:CR=1 FL=1
MENFLEEIYSKALEMRQVQTDLKTLPVGEERKETAHEWANLVHWMADRLVVARDKFAKFLKLES